MPLPAQQQWAEAQESHWGERFRFAALDIPLEWMNDNACAFSDAAPILLDFIEDFDAELLLSSQYCFGALKSPIPRVVVAHSDVLSWAQACRPEGLAKSAWLETYCDLVCRGLEKTDALVAPTRRMLDALAANFMLPAQSVVIANGRTLPIAELARPRKLQAVTAGRLWDEAKNLQILELVDSPIPISIVGEERFQSDHHILSLGRLNRLGVLAEEQLMRVFRESAIYICPSRYEPFGLAALEAALCGCAVVANDIPSLHEVWGDSALYFSGPESLSVILRDLCRYPGRLREAQRRSMCRAQMFSAERMADGYCELFISILKQSQVANYVP
jgi:glycosyltransferase involved in cell wall biosynthesis